MIVMVGVTSNLSQRDLRPEIMDDPALPRREHEAALRGLARINRFSNTAQALWRLIGADARRSDRPLRVLDVASGGGDVAIELVTLAEREGVKLEVCGCDRNAVAVAYSQERSAGRARFVVADALADELPEADVVTSCLFLHHLTRADAVRLLQRLAGHAPRVIVDDLCRSWLGLALAWAGTRVLSRSSVVHEDGPQSVRAAFSVAEVRDLAREAGMAGARISQRWPCRFTLDWRRP